MHAHNSPGEEHYINLFGYSSTCFLYFQKYFGYCREESSTISFETVYLFQGIKLVK